MGVKAPVRDLGPPHRVPETTKGCIFSLASPEGKLLGQGEWQEPMDPENLNTAHFLKRYS